MYFTYQSGLEHRSCRPNFKKRLVFTSIHFSTKWLKNIGEVIFLICQAIALMPDPQSRVMKIGWKKWVIYFEKHYSVNPLTNFMTEKGVLFFRNKPSQYSNDKTLAQFIQNNSSRGDVKILSK